jgi:hypothetical protein
MYVSPFVLPRTSGRVLKRKPGDSNLLKNAAGSVRRRAAVQNQSPGIKMHTDDLSRDSLTNLKREAFELWVFYKTSVR